MKTLEQAAQQALEALEVSTDWDISATGKQSQSMRAITALREALAQPQGEWVDLTDEELAESLGWKLGAPMYMTVVGLGHEAIAAFKEKNK